MESVVRKLLPRVPVSTPGPNRQIPVAPADSIRNGTQAGERGIGPLQHPQWTSAIREEPDLKRKRIQLDDPAPPPSNTQALPSVQHLLTAGLSNSQAPPTEPNGHARLIRTSNDAYNHEGPFHFRAPPPQSTFPVSISEDSRPLSFAVVEPELMHIFRRAWYLRQYVRLKRMRGESWLDHIFFNDCFGIDNVLYTWTSPYEPGMMQYSASLLYKHCLWLFFNRSVQASQPSPAYAQVVEDGLHYVRGIENALGSTGDRSILLLPLFLLGVSAFYPEQRRDVWEALDRLDPISSNEAVIHAVKSLERIWSLMDDGHAMATWEWEKYHAHEHVCATRDRSLMDFLADPLAPVAQTSHVRSPDAHDYDPTTLRATRRPSQLSPSDRFAPSPAHLSQSQMRHESVYTPPTPPRRPLSPHRNHSIASVDVPDTNRSDGLEVRENCLAPKPPAAESTPTQHSHPNDVIQVLHRKHFKSRSSIPPCSVCGKELKNPSDAQKHQLQHSKPFRCQEAGCTRAQGFATENDLQRHRKSVHGASPRIGNKIGYVCAACPEPSDGTSRKWWPRLDNFKAHIRRKHQEKDEEELIGLSASANRPGDGSYSDSAYYSSSRTSSLRWTSGSVNEHPPPPPQTHESQLPQATTESPDEYQYVHSNEQPYESTLHASPEPDDRELASHHRGERSESDEYVDADVEPGVDGPGRRTLRPDEVGEEDGESEDVEEEHSDDMEVDLPNGKVNGRLVEAVDSVA